MNRRDSKIWCENCSLSLRIIIEYFLYNFKDLFHAQRSHGNLTQTLIDFMPYIGKFLLDTNELVCSRVLPAAIYTVQYIQNNLPGHCNVLLIAAPKDLTLD